MQLVQKFFKAIGLGSLIDWITFTFCDFLKLIGLPTSITLSIDLIIESVIGATAVSLPSLSAVATDMSGIYEFTTEENKTEYSPARDLPITPDSGPWSVILDNVKLTETTDYTWDGAELSLVLQPLADKKLLIIQ